MDVVVVLMLCVSGQPELSESSISSSHTDQHNSTRRLCLFHFLLRQGEGITPITSHGCTTMENTVNTRQVVRWDEHEHMGISICIYQRSRESMHDPIQRHLPLVHSSPWAGPVTAVKRRRVPTDMGKHCRATFEEKMRVKYAHPRSLLERPRRVFCLVESHASIWTSGKHFRQIHNRCPKSRV